MRRSWRGRASWRSRLLERVDGLSKKPAKIPRAQSPHPAFSRKADIMGRGDTMRAYRSKTVGEWPTYSQRIFGAIDPDDCVTCTCRWRCNGNEAPKGGRWLSILSISATCTDRSKPKGRTDLGPGKDFCTPIAKKNVRYSSEASTSYSMSVRMMYLAPFLTPVPSCSRAPLVSP